MRRQIETAEQLGFSTARVQISLTPDSMEKLLPVAERHGVVLALEVHADQYATHPRILTLRDRYEALASPYLGFTMDWGATVRGFAPSLLEAYRRRGLPEALLVDAQQLWTEFAADGPPADAAEHGARFGRFIGLAQKHGRGDIGIDLGVNATGLFGAAAVDTWNEVAPWIRHVHGKFFGIDEHGHEPTVPVAELITLLVQNGYSGAISTEYEGWHWNNWQDPFDIVRAEHVLQRHAASRAGSKMITAFKEARTQLGAWSRR
jgi:hypothetical protein